MNTANMNELDMNDTKINDTKINDTKMNETIVYKKNCLMHLAEGIYSLLYIIVYYLEPHEMAKLCLTRKIFGPLIEVISKKLAIYIHNKHFSCMFLPEISKTYIPWTHYLHKIVSNKIQRILLIGGFKDNIKIKRVLMMVIESNKISWEVCREITNEKDTISHLYTKDKILLIGSSYYNYDNDSTTFQNYILNSEKLNNVFNSEKLNNVFNSEKLNNVIPPIFNVFYFSIIEFNNKFFAIGGVYRNANHNIRSNRIFCLDNGEWIEQTARLSIARNNCKTIVYNNKIYIAGGYDGQYHLSCIESFDPINNELKFEGNLSRSRKCEINLFVINEELFASGYNNCMFIEKYQNGTWQILTENYESNRTSCSIVASDFYIYFIGGSQSSKFTWNRYNVRTNQWSSEIDYFADETRRKIDYFADETRRKIDYFADETRRKIPNYGFTMGQAVCITPSNKYTWTSYQDL
jgi:hypothetical protein